MNKSIIQRLGTILSVFLLSACAPEKPPKLAEFAPIVRPSGPEKPQYSNGSLYQINAPAASLYSDTRPHSLGDILTVVLQENTNATKSTATSTTKEDSIDLTTPDIITRRLGGVSGDLADLLTGVLNGGQELTNDREFSGEGSSNQSNSLTGNITVTVVDVFPNGNLVIKGEKWLTLNQGQEYIRIAGVIRPGDIQPDNTILSTRIADAQIAYSGEGFIHDANQQGWLSRFFGGPYWPF